MMERIRVGVLCGGRSGEHEVSLQSARNVLAAMDRRKYEPVVIGIHKSGEWHLYPPEAFLLHEDDPKRIRLAESGEALAVVPGGKSGALVRVRGSEAVADLDVIFPVLHGPFGEDGTVQGLLRLTGLPFVGAGVLGSAVGMDKDVMKRLLRDAGIPTASFLVLHWERDEMPDFAGVSRQLGCPFFVKPANYGSSIGISRVEGPDDYPRALAEAFRYDHKVVVESLVRGREIECSVLGNEDPVASVPGEVVPKRTFYSYEAKYLDEDGADLKIPADLPEHLTDRVRKLAVRAFQALCCEGMARVDAFVTPEEEVLVNEINTIPGFTKISMYPMLWEESGIPYGELIHRLIRLALERHERDKMKAN